MPHPSRPARAARTAGGRFTSTSATTTTTTPTPNTLDDDTIPSTSRPLNTSNGITRVQAEEQGVGKGSEGLRPAKRRKLEIRGPRQQTLDGFFGAAGALAKPPASFRLTEPHGQLIERVNGVQNELDVNEDEILRDAPTASSSGQQPTAAIVSPPRRKQEDKRTLRSQDEGPRLKSELATYFPNYEEVIFDTPFEQDFITVDTNVYIADDGHTKQHKAETPSPSKSMHSSKSTPTSARQKVGNSGEASSPPRPAHNAPTLDFSLFARNLPERPEDPLSDEAFLKSHKRAERKEKQMRNIEREHAMHEKVQLERLLNGLLGHDWLRVLGISGVTEGEARKFEGKRDYFVAEVQGLVNKFKEWKEEEKRQRVEKGAALVAEREAVELEGEEDEDGTEVSSIEPASNDLNASAARQLQQETASAVKSLAGKAKGKDRPSKASAPAPFIPYRPPSPITSFFPSRHLRETALKKSSRSSRNSTAFGLPFPEVEDREFELPAEYVTEDVLRASARERRRRKRESVAASAST